MDAQDDTGNTIDVTVVDDAGNSTGPVTSAVSYVIDTNVPVFATSGLSISTDNGVVGVAAVNGGVVAADQVNVNATLAAADSDTITWDATPIGGGATIANNTPATVVAGTTDSATQAFNVTATDNAGNVTNSDTNTVDGSTISVDNQPPSITDNGTLTISTDAGTVGLAEIGDKVTQSSVTLAAGDGDTTTIDLSTPNLTGEAALAATVESTAIVAGSIDNAAQAFTITVTDDAGNTDTIASDSLNVYNIAVSSLSATSVTLSDTDVNDPVTFTIAFTTTSAWPADGKFEITFPSKFIVSGLNGQTATNQSGTLDGTLTAAVSGQVVTITRNNDGGSVAGSTAVSFDIGTGINGANAGATGTFAFKTQTNAGGTLDQDLTVSGVTLYDFTPQEPTGEVTPTGGGGGGGGQTSITSNTTTSTLVSEIDTISGDQTYSRPVQYTEESMIVNEEDNTKTVQATEDGTLTIKPNQQSTISLTIPSYTEVEGTMDWNGKIEPPLIRSKTIVSVDGDEISETVDALQRGDVILVVKAGSTSSALTFSNEVTLEIPLDVQDGTVVNVYSSPDGDTWEYLGTAVVENGMVIIKTDHLSYFAVERTGELHEAAPAISFNDILGHWAESYISRITDLGIVSGKTPTAYAPDDAITRAELIKVAVKTFGIPVDPVATYMPFNDVYTAAWYTPYIIAAKENGIIQVYGNEFRPNATINRVEALKILLEAAGFEDIDSNYEINYTNKPGWWFVFFRDVLIGEWYAKYVAYAKDFDIVSGYPDGTFGPGSNITRSEVAKIVVKILDML